MDYPGIRLEERNLVADPSCIEPLHVDDAKVRILVISNDEERAIYMEGFLLLKQQTPCASLKSSM